MLFCPKCCKKEANIDKIQFWPGKLCFLWQNQNSCIPKVNHMAFFALDVYCKILKDEDKKRLEITRKPTYHTQAWAPFLGVGHPSLSLNILLFPMANSFVRKLGCSLNCAQHQTMITATNKSSLLVLGIYCLLPYNTFSQRHCDQ